MISRIMLRWLVFLIALLVNVNAYIPEGAPCTADGYPGTCRNWKKCFTLIIDHRDQKHPPICSYNGLEPIICCTSCKLVEDVSKAVINPRGFLLWRTEQKSWNKCIDYYLELPYKEFYSQVGTVLKEWNSTRKCFDIMWGVVGAAGGRDATRSEFPHMALLGYGRSKDTTQWLCGGSLLNNWFILTAGHCISSPHVGPVTSAALGMLKRSDPEKLWHIYKIGNVIPHPLYRSPSKYHDIALLKTAKKIIFNKNVLPTCLPNLAFPEQGGEAVATGWGTTGRNAALADTLQAVRVKQFSKSRCSMLYRSHRHLRLGFNPTTQMCYGDEKQIRDTCQGDSGGPLHVWANNYSINQRTIIGVTSYGRNCGFVGQAGVYTKLRPYVSWIDQIIWKDQ